ncbi:hypothetical protein AB0F66_27810, partial [Micromonospora orduensis]
MAEWPEQQHSDDHQGGQEQQVGQAVDPATPPRGRARRVVLKLSGEVFGGGAIGVDPDVVQA